MSGEELSQDEFLEKADTIAKSLKSGSTSKSPNRWAVRIASYKMSDVPKDEIRNRIYSLMNQVPIFQIERNKILPDQKVYEELGGSATDYTTRDLHYITVDDLIEYIDDTDVPDDENGIGINLRCTLDFNDHHVKNGSLRFSLLGEEHGVVGSVDMNTEWSERILSALDGAQRIDIRVDNLWYIPGAGIVFFNRMKNMEVVD